MSLRTSLTLAAAAGLAGAALLATPAQASDSFKIHDSVDVIGQSFSCASGDLLITAGVITESIEGHADAQGVFHVTGTIVPKGVTLTDGTTTYYLSGASWFGAKGTDPEADPSVFTNTDHFVIRTATGGVFAKVSIVEHLSPSGGYFLKDTGACETPAD